MGKREENYSIMDMQMLGGKKEISNLFFGKKNTLLWQANDFINDWCCCRALYRISPERNERFLNPSSFSNNKALPNQNPSENSIGRNKTNHSFRNHSD